MNMASAATKSAAGMNAFRIGNVFTRTFGLMSRHFVLFFLVVAAAQVPTLIITLQMSPGRLHQAGAVSVAVWLNFVLLPLTQTIIYHAAFQEMLGRPIRFGSSFAIALRRFFPVLGTLICMGVVIGFGFVLLVVPGLIWATMFAIAVPACVVERLGPFRSLGRSRFLTKGNRWKILGIGLLTFLIAVAVDAATGAVTFTVGSTFGGLVPLLMGAILMAFYSVLGVVIYHDLRASREGVTTDRIAAVFD
jgi:hypothetical protein